MTSLQLKEQLLARLKSQSLNHFYILESSARTDARRKHLNQWMDDFLAAVIMQEKGIKNKAAALEVLKQGTPDLLLLRRPTEDEENPATTPYLVEDIEEVLRFQFFSAMQFSWRFVVLYDAHLLGKTVLNKMLKTLEEPQKKTTLFFLCPEQNNILPTVKSRAQTLLLSPVAEESAAHWEGQKLLSKKDMQGQLVKHLKGGGLSEYWPEDKQTLRMDYLEGKISEIEFLEGLRYAPHLQLDLYHMLLDLERSSDSNFEDKARILKDIRWFTEAKIYNNDFKERLYALLRDLR